MNLPLFLDVDLHVLDKEVIIAEFDKIVSILREDTWNHVNARASLKSYVVLFDVN